MGLAEDWRSVVVGWRCRYMLVVVVMTMISLPLLVPSSAFPSFKQPFVRSIEDTTAGSRLNLVGGGGLAINEAGDLWVGNGQKDLSEFDSSGTFIKTIDLTRPGVSPEIANEGNTRPNSVSIDNSTNLFFVTGKSTENEFASFVEVFPENGELQQLWEKNGAATNKFGNANVTVDNSNAPLEDPSACVLSVCTVYVSQAEASETAPTAGIDKFNSSGARVDFECSTCSYVKGSEITGTPSGEFTPNTVNGMAVDAKGDIYLVDNEYKDNTPAVVEYRPNGEFVQAFTGLETPGLDGKGIEGGFGGSLEDVTVDPTTGLMFVSVDEDEENVGAVDEFDISSGRFVNQITETTPGKILNSAYAVAVDQLGDLFVVDSDSKNTTNDTIDEYGPGGFVPDFKLAEATDRTSSSAVLNGLVNPESNDEVSGLSECRFEYVSEEIYDKEEFTKSSSAECEPGASEIPHDDNYHAVHVSVHDLVSGTGYYYRVSAKSAGALGATNYSLPLEFTAPGPPSVLSSAVENVSSTFADFHAQIDPVGANTTYYFEYGTTTAYGEVVPVSTAAEPHGVDIGSGGQAGNLDASVVQRVSDLAPATTYHFRVVATNKFTNSMGKEETGIAYGPDVVFTTVPSPSQGLPDGRAYELVTPPDKGSAEDMFGFLEKEYHQFLNDDFGYASETGNQFLLETRAAFGPYPASEDGTSSPDGGHNVYVFSRSGRGWRTIPFAQPSLGVQSVFANVFNPEDFSELGIDDEVGAEFSVSGVHHVSFVATLGGESGGPSFMEAFGENGYHEPSTDEGRMVGASRNLEHIVLESDNHTLISGDNAQDPGTPSLYESAGGKLALVNVNSEGSLLSRCGAVLGQNSGEAGASHNAVSSSGSKVFFTAPDPNDTGAECWNSKTEEHAPQLYMRAEGNTTQISEPERGVTEEGSPEENETPVQHPAIYVGASENGSKVFFITETEMTGEAAELKLHDPELYEYDTEAPEGKRLVRVSRGEDGSPVAEGAPAEVYIVDAVSAEGNAVYFTAFGQLAPGAPVVQGEELNLYRYDTVTGKTTYVASVNEQDYPSISAASWWNDARRSPKETIKEIALATNANWYTTPNGDYLLFGTGNELDPDYSTVEAQPNDCPTLNSNGLAANGHCFEVYRYDALLPVSEGRKAEGIPDNPLCVSCDPSGEAPSSDAFFGHSAGLEPPAAGPVRAMSNDGSYVFFDTADPLVPRDTNNTLDVYEWHEGTVSLISSGIESSPSYFLGASPDGKNVFFGTHAKLVPQDTDTAGDVYDARVCEPGAGDPCVGPPAGGTAECEGDACQSQPPQSIDSTPVSLSFSGSGNIMSKVSEQVNKAKSKPLTRSQRLAKALKMCSKIKAKRKRAACDAQARKRYGKKSKASKSKTNRRSIERIVRMGHSARTSGGGGQ